ncbi:dihydrofolate reductase family protein [Kineococcus glutinatus]|uniref:Bacterial bifunctional deaminase-reductase C-terminal domain-containing protein n=1 Tax=Kineococcus glutinatus TaxID=1070872 RepID=A0ABP9HRB5_9ACTN
MRSLTYFVGVTLDGFIAAPDGSFDFFPLTGAFLDFLAAEHPDTLPQHVRAQLGIDAAPTRRFDAVVMGRRTYQPALELGVPSPYPHLDQHVVSTTLPLDPAPGVTVTEDPLATVRALKAADGLGVWLAGGGTLAGALLPEIDELVLKRYPVLAGAGVPVVAGSFAPHAFTLVEERAVDQVTVSRFVRA